MRTQKCDQNLPLTLVVDTQAPITVCPKQGAGFLGVQAGGFVVSGR